MSETIPPKFSDFGFHPEIMRALAASGYTQPTPIQAQAIPVVLQGHDVMGAAQTGTGKTAAFTLPILQRLLPFASSSPSPARHPVRALIITPTRELTDQVSESVRKYGSATALRSAVVFGGVDIKPQKEQLRHGVEILIATPGRLLDHVQQKNVNLSQVQILVLDEADRMLDMGFMPDILRIIDLLPKQRQSLLFSATFSNEIRKLAAGLLNNPISIEVARRNQTADTVTQSVYQLHSAEQKRAAVSYLIRELGLKQVIVFSNSKLGAARLARELERDGINAGAIHGDKSQIERIKALEAFKAGELVALVATDVAARGIDIVDLPCVINYDLPFSPEDYVHRIGRTGRAGSEGKAISLYAPEDEKYLQAIEKLIKRTLQRDTLPPEVLQHHRPRVAREHAKPTRSSRPSEPYSPRAKPPAADAWYMKPYEAQSADTTANGLPPAADPAKTAATSRTAPRKVAALFGSKKKT
ncbi:MAG: DEAD/DEAH box helicase [Burkholderiaceae bacterium]|nr:MAG: DEAD/DEAH box helicase [Burkholderiaceae bacterium]